MGEERACKFSSSPFRRGQPVLDCNSASQGNPSSDSSLSGLCISLPAPYRRYLDVSTPPALQQLLLAACCLGPTAALPHTSRSFSPGLRSCCSVGEQCLLGACLSEAVGAMACLWESLNAEALFPQEKAPRRLSPFLSAAL